MKKIVSIILVISILFLSGCSINSKTPKDTNKTNQTEQKEENVVANDKAIDFTLKNIEGQEIKLSDYKGKAIIVNFFATWCPPCKAEFPGFIQLVDEYKNDSNVVFVFVNVGEDKKTVEAFLNERNYKIKPLLDEKTDVAALYRVTGIPTTVIINKEFNIETIHIGFMEKRDLKNYIEALK
ncbi:MAG: TlpA family protein disulfide reductase [Caloramator sp.]|jgi:thiol-disulfide isomerase/thioredoxin|uniref:TlpA family protein disulfide reductase n=1 Tax=Caloramator sp. TaxID=1871330 RepID=UPI001D8F3247|nr:TlpA disulfide reductase family protein [Caloramator sp.]MBZ4664171.1 TlpA family protein disulfide reductase [Caloramator sp.]